jgi:hypothetical protein
LVGGQARLLCPVCSNRCNQIGPESAPKPAASRAERLLETIRIAFDFRRQKPPGRK